MPIVVSVKVVETDDSHVTIEVVGSQPGSQTRSIVYKEFGTMYTDQDEESYVRKAVRQWINEYLPDGASSQIWKMRQDSDDWIGILSQQGE